MRYICNMREKQLSNFFSALVRISTDSIYSGGEDYFTSSVNFCYIVFESAKLIRNKLPFLRGLLFCRPQNTSPGTACEIEIDTQTRGVKKKIFTMSETQQPMEEMSCESFNLHPRKYIKTSFNTQLTEVSSSPTQKPDFLDDLKSLKRKSRKRNKPEFPKDSDRKDRPRPNYFVAVKVSDPEIHGIVKEIQQHIYSLDSRFDKCMVSVPTLHITLMVMYIGDTETHERAMQALTNAHREHNDVMCKDPVNLEFCGLGQFKNKVLFGKIKENESYTRFCNLAYSVQKHFAELEIFSTDTRTEFNPHLTIAKIDFLDRKQRALKKIEPSLYNEFIDRHLGSETIRSLQLLKMSGPKGSTGYYTGEELFFQI